MDAGLIQELALGGRVAVVTGAASGIGRETACVFARAGAVVVLGDVDEAALADTAASVEVLGGRAVVRRTDVAQRPEVEALAAAALALGRLDAWVNAAGIISFSPILDTSEAELDRLFAVNLKGSYWGCAAAGRAMRGQGRGAIVNIASAAADLPGADVSVYSMSKAAVNTLTRSAAKEFGAFGCRVNAIAPGWIDTPLVTYLYTDAEGRTDPARREAVIRQRASGSPLGLTGTAHDVALCALYLASDASRFMTGQVLRPNGGVVMP